MNLHTMKTKGIRANKTGRLKVSAKLCKRSIAKMLKEASEKKRGANGDKRFPDRCTHIRMMVAALKGRYEIRFNSVTACTEYRKKGSGAAFAALDIRALRRITLEVQIEGMAVSINDVRNYLESDIVDCFDPIENFLKACRGKWDGKDRIGGLAATVAAGDEKGEKRFHTWFLGMVAQWTGMTGAVYGNSSVPLLISAQGFNKSTFCRRLLPPELRWGYCDSLQLQEKRQVLRAMSELLLINLDEFNQISPQLQQGFLKNVVQLPSVKTKRPYGNRLEEMARRASFIATSNMQDVLADPSGNRRFICIDIKKPIDVSAEIDYTQLYAQALDEIGHGRKWYFDKLETEQLIADNSIFQKTSAAEDFFLEYFRMGKDENDAAYMTATAIFIILRKRVGAAVANTSLSAFSRRLKSMPGMISKRTAKGNEFLVELV